MRCRCVLGVVIVAYVVQPVSSGEFGDKEGGATTLINQEDQEKLLEQQFLLSFTKKHLEKSWARDQGSFISGWENEQKENKEWRVKHAKLMETAWDAVDTDLLELKTDFYDDTPLKFPVTLVMAENRLSSGLWRASVAQKHAYAKKHGYGFHISATGRYVYDPAHSTISPRAFNNAEGLVAMCEHMLAEKDVTPPFSQKAKDHLQTCADIPKTGQLGKGIGAAREATTDRHFPMYMKKALYWQLDHQGPSNGNYDQDFGVLEGTWSKVSATLEAMRAVPEGSWIWVLDTDIVIMDDTLKLDYIINFAEKIGRELIVTSWNCGDGMNMGSVMVKNTEYGRTLYEQMKDMRVVWHTYFFHSATGNTEQGAMWTMQAGDVILQEKTYAAPPRTFNNRHELIECAYEAEQVARV
jgi:hypothetical protein